MTDPIMTIPFVHMNGSAKAMLLAAAEDFYGALDDAMGALAQMAPNGRDYYPGGPELYSQAVDGFEKALGVLSGLKDSTEAYIDRVTRETGPNQP